jgi:hypothetical protein
MGAWKTLRHLPKQNIVTVILANGASVSMPMTVRKFLNKYKMTVDPTNHPLWSGQKAEVRFSAPSPLWPPNADPLRTPTG